MANEGWMRSEAKHTVYFLLWLYHMMDDTLTEHTPIAMMLINGGIYVHVWSVLKCRCKMCVATVLFVSFVAQLHPQTVSC